MTVIANRYQLLHRIGNGNMSEVYQAEDLRQGKRREISLDLKKELKDGLIQKADVSQQVREQDLMVRIDASKQGFAHLRDLFVQRALSQFSEYL